MNPKDVREEIATRLGTIEGLHAYAWPLGGPPPIPAAIVQPQRIEYDKTYGRGSDMLGMTVIVLTGQPSDQASHIRMDALMASTGAGSIKAALDGDGWTSCDYVHTVAGDWDAVAFGGVEFLACLVELQIEGSGRS